MKVTILTGLFLMMNFAAMAADPWRVYVANFDSEDTDYQTIAREIADDFQLVLQTCNKRFKVLDRSLYISWIEEAKNKNVSEDKQLLQSQDLDYLVFGEVYYNKFTSNYTIEYGFEEVNTGYILMDNLIFTFKGDFENRARRYDLIFKRITEEFELCEHEKIKTQKVAVEIRKSIKHEFRDTDGDGIPNLIDEEDNTPPHALVNSRGVAYTKEELDLKLVETAEAEKQDEMDKMLQQMMPEMPSVMFSINSNKIEEENYTALHQIAKVMEMYPAIRVVITGNTKGNSELLAYQRSYNTITYLMKNYDIPQKRLILAYRNLENDKDNTVAFDVTTKDDLTDMEEP